jgi:hypothetical protein
MVELTASLEPWSDHSDLAPPITGPEVMMPPLIEDVTERDGARDDPAGDSAFHLLPPGTQQHLRTKAASLGIDPDTAPWSRLTIRVRYATLTARPPRGPLSNTVVTQ